MNKSVSGRDISSLVSKISRKESGKIISVLTRIFGSDNMELAEDVFQDALLKALTHWKEEGVPEYPTAWIYRVAKNKALNIINHEKYKHKYASEISELFKSEWAVNSAIKHFFSEEEIDDDQLRMMFTSCHSALTKDSQVALTLKTLCGFSTSEIAQAFLTKEDTINKRLVRARRTIREAKIPFEVPRGEELSERLEAVLEVIYFVFNEGYKASSGDRLIRYDLCLEAIRLAELIADHSSITNKSNVYALLSLMLLNASRFKARQDSKGNIVPLPEQDRSLWDSELISRGFSSLHKSLEEGKVSKYHILAAISAYHCSASDYKATDWKQILSLYDNLLFYDASEIVHLNRAIAVANIHGPQAAIDALDEANKDSSLNSYHLYYSVKAEFYIQLGDTSKAKSNLDKAIGLSSLEIERELLKEKIEQLS